MKKWLIVIFLFFSFCIHGQIKVTPSVHDFGYFPESLEVVSTTFTLENISSDTVQIINLKPSCGCTVVLMDTSFIAPGSKTSIDVEYIAQDRPGSFFKTIKVHFKKQSKIWATHLGIKGYVVPEVHADTGSVATLEGLSIQPFNNYFRHRLDTTGFINNAFQEFINGLTYAIDKDQFVLLHPVVNFFHDYGEYQFILEKLQNNIRYELNRRGYTSEVVLFQIPEINVLPKEDYLHEGMIQMQVMGYNVDHENSAPYNLRWEKQQESKDSIRQLENLLNLSAPTLSQLEVQKNEDAIFDLSNTIVRKHMLEQLYELQITYQAASPSEKLKKFIEQWKDDLLKSFQETVPDVVPLNFLPTKFIPQVATGKNFIVKVDHVVRRKEKDTITHYFQLAEDKVVRPQMPIMQFKTNQPGKGDLELLQKRRLFANFKAYQAEDDTLEIVCILQHNGYLFDKSEKLIINAIDHYKVVLEALQREAERQGFITQTKFWIQPFHVTHWDKNDQNYVSVQFLSQIKNTHAVSYPREKFVGFYNSSQTGAVEMAGVHHYYLDEMAKVITQKGWLAISLESYMYVEEEDEDMKAIQIALITQTKKAIQQIKSELLARGVDPRRLILYKEKIIVRNKPLDNVNGFGLHQPKNTVNNRFTKVVFNPGFDF